jgi:hypothetical protein
MGFYYTFIYLSSFRCIKKWAIITFFNNYFFVILIIISFLCSFNILYKQLLSSFVKRTRSLHICTSRRLYKFFFSSVLCMVWWCPEYRPKVITIVNYWWCCCLWRCIEHLYRMTCTAVMCHFTVIFQFFASLQPERWNPLARKSSFEATTHFKDSISFTKYRPIDRRSTDWMGKHNKLISDMKLNYSTLRFPLMTNELIFITNQ